MAGAATRFCAARGVLRQGEGWQSAKILTCEIVQSCILHDFRFSPNSISCASKPKLSDSCELWDTRPASECDLDDATKASRHNFAAPQSAAPALGHRIATGLRGARQLF